MSRVVQAPRLLLRSLVRQALRFGPRALRRATERIPFSRFSRLSSRLFWGEVTIRWRDVKVRVNPGEVHGFYPYFLGEYSGEEIDRLNELCRNASVFYDVGANIGLISLAVARACPQLTVIAFEPDRQIAARFQENVQLNSDLKERVHLVEAAASSQDGYVEFAPSLDARNIGVGRVIVSNAVLSPAGTYSVPAYRLDTFAEKSGWIPDVVKIDVEGFELEVLKGMEGLFCQGYPHAILVEVHAFYHEDGALFKKQVFSALGRWGYVCFSLNGERSIPEQWPDRVHLVAKRAQSYGHLSLP